MVLLRDVQSKSSSKSSSSSSTRARPSGKIRIGVLLTYPELEQKKEELVGNKLYDTAFPWLKGVDKDFEVERKWKFEQLKKRADARGKFGVPSDVAVGYYVGRTFKNVQVDLILPHEVSLKRLRSNHLNFLMIYDVLEAFHTDKSEDKHIYHNVKKCLKEAGNIFPPPAYQELVYSKIKYYNYMKENNISIAPTLTMTAEQYRPLGNAGAVEKVLKHAQAENWTGFVCKPVLGQESKDVKYFKPEDAGCKKELSKYLKYGMATYPGIIIQKEIEGLGHYTKCPELRMFFCGNDYKYTAVAGGDWFAKPSTEGGKMNAPMDKLKPVVKGILKKLPKIVMPDGTELPRLLTRLDMGFKIDGQFKPFVNELEFVPALFVEHIEVPLVSDMIKSLGNQMVRITKQYVNKKKRPVRQVKKTVKTHRLRVMKRAKHAGA